MCPMVQLNYLDVFHELASEVEPSYCFQRLCIQISGLHPALFSRIVLHNQFLFCKHIM